MQLGMTEIRQEISGIKQEISGIKSKLQAVDRKLEMNSLEHQQLKTMIRELDTEVVQFRHLSHNRR